MTAFLKIDDCEGCHRALPWEWTPAVLLGGRRLAGTGVWRSQLTDGVCPACIAAVEAQQDKQYHALNLRRELVDLLGGEKPYREFTLARYRVTPGNQLAYARSENFNPASDNLYLWGPCGVGKTHLAWAIARKFLEETLSVTIVRAFQLSRRVRMREPEQEQAGIDGFARAQVLVVDDLGIGPDTAFSRQILQEILDARDFNDRTGLVVTSQYSLDALADKLFTDSICSRLAGMCQVIKVSGVDGRLSWDRRE